MTGTAAAQTAPRLEVTWLRTSTLLLDFGGFRVLTDPWFGSWMRILPVFRRPGLALEALPPVDLLLVSHLHADHFSAADARIIARGNPGLEAVGCPGATPAFAEAGIRGIELAPGASTRVGPLEITAVECAHTGPPPAEVNYAVEWRGLGVFFGGDARYSAAFEETARGFRTDVALLPIGGTLIFGHRTTMDPDDAHRAARALGARFVVPTHEGMEWMPVPPASWHPGRTRAFEALCRAEPSGPRAVRLRPGERATFERRDADLDLVEVAIHPGGRLDRSARLVP